MLGACRTTTTIDGNRVSNDTPVAGAVEGDAHKRAAVRLQLAASYYQKGQLQIAVDEARRAIDLDPSLVAAHGLLGLLYMSLGQADTAEASFRRGMAIDRDDPDLNNNYGWFLCMSQRERDALAYFDRAVANRLYQTPAMALQNAGICLLRIGDDKQAEKYLLRAFENDASSPVAKYQLAQLYLARHQWERADFYYDLLAKTVEPSSESLWLGVRLAHGKGDQRQLRRLGDELLARFPDTAQAEALRKGQFE